MKEMSPKYQQLKELFETGALIRTNSDVVCGVTGEIKTAYRGKTKGVNIKGSFLSLKQYDYFQSIRNENDKDAKEIFIGDLETTTKKEDCRVWAWELRNVNHPENFIYGTNITEMMYILNHDIKNAILYFHNLKFDGIFITDYLLRNGFHQVEPKEKAPNTFTAHIVEGRYYSLTIVYEKIPGKNKGWREIEIFDSSKLLPMSVKQLGKSFQVGDGKGDIDYHKERPIGYQPTQEELNYLHQDCLIVATALKFMLDQGHTKMTIGSNAFKDFQNIIGEWEYKNLFPKLPMGVNEDIHKAYRGGWTYLNTDHPNYKEGTGILTASGQVLDVNSLYPYIMRTELLPYGEPERYTGYYEKQSKLQREMHPLYIQEMWVSLKLKEGHVPTIPKNNAIRTHAEYIKATGGRPIFMRLTNKDIQQMKKHYEFYIHKEMKYQPHNKYWEPKVPLGGYMFKAKRGIFNKYIDKWMSVKEKAGMEGNTGLYLISKLFLNSLYGKFASRWTTSSQFCELNDDDIVSLKDIQDWYEMTDEEQEKVYTKRVKYPAMAVFITAAARHFTIEKAQQNFDRFCYADTDSLHLTGWEEPKGLEVDSKKLGAWKKEYKFTKAIFIRPKTYYELKENGEPHITASGMSEECKQYVTFENFRLWDGIEPKPGQKAGKGVFYGNKRPKKVPGGVILEDKYFYMKDVMLLKDHPIHKIIEQLKSKVY